MVSDIDSSTARPAQSSMLNFSSLEWMTGMGSSKKRAVAPGPTMDNRGYRIGYV